MAFSIGNIFFLLRDIYFFVSVQMREVMASLVVPLKQSNTQSRISPEILEQCSSNLAPESYITKKKQNDTYYVVAMATILAPVSFSEKPNIPICNLIKWV